MRNELARRFLDDLAADWRENGNGKATIARLRDERPHDYVRAVISVLPRDSASEPGHDMTDDEQIQRIRQLIAELDDVLGLGAQAPSSPGDGEAPRVTGSRPTVRTPSRPSSTPAAAPRERLFMAGNQLGKTLAGGSEWAFHLTGRYPDWWVGLQFAKPTRRGARGTRRITRDNPQRILIGPPAQAEWGTGTIPGDALVRARRRAASPT